MRLLDEHAWQLKWMMLHLLLFLLINTTAPTSQNPSTTAFTAYPAMGLTGFQKKLRASRAGMQQMSEWPIRYCICPLTIITISLGVYCSWETVLSILCSSSFKTLATPCKESIIVPTGHRREMTHPSLCSWLEGKAEIRTQGYHWTPKTGVVTYMLCSLWPKYVLKNLNTDSFPHPCKY